MNLLQQFQQYINKEKLFQPQDRLLLAVSGGVDSIVLCHLCKQAGYDFAIAHCNFQLREDESDADEALVQMLAAGYQVEIFVRKFDTSAYATENKESIQVAARNLRYAWFAELVDTKSGKPFKKLLTAHHANDNVETLLINFFKGTGVAGLQGILPKSGNEQQIIRPLLFAKKEILLQYAGENGLTYREDASNQSDKYTRNYFRNTLIPALAKVYPKVEDNLLGNINRFSEVNMLYKQAIAQLKKKLLVQNKGTLQMPVEKLLKTEALQTVLFEITKDYGFTSKQTLDIIRLLTAGSGKFIDSTTHRIIKNRKWLIISLLRSVDQSYYLIEESDEQLQFAGQSIIVKRVPKPLKIEYDSLIAQLDAKEIVFPLLLRKWQRGDYFYPLGMKKKKKLSRFFIDNKLSLPQKENTWVIEMDKKIVWVVGQRIDDRFKITTNTQTIIRIELLPA